MKVSRLVIISFKTHIIQLRIWLYSTSFLLRNRKIEIKYRLFKISKSTSAFGIIEIVDFLKIFQSILVKDKIFKIMVLHRFLISWMQFTIQQPVIFIILTTSAWILISLIVIFSDTMSSISNYLIVYIFNTKSLKLLMCLVMRIIKESINHSLKASTTHYQNMCKYN